MNTFVRLNIFFILIYRPSRKWKKKLYAMNSETRITFSLWNSSNKLVSFFLSSGAMILSGTTLASENVPIPYTEFNTSICYCVKKKLASDMKLELESGMLRTSPFSNKPCHKGMFSLYWNKTTGNAIWRYEIWHGLRWQCSRAHWVELSAFVMWGVGSNVMSVMSSISRYNRAWSLNPPTTVR